jgi:hypothetical protein
MSKSEIKVLTPVGMLGYGIPADHFWRGIEGGIDAIIVDSGSTDPGPYQLGLGATLVPRAAYVRDLTLILQACHLHRIPVYIGSAGGPGINQHVDWMVDIIREIAAKNGYRFKVAAIYADVDHALVHRRLDEARTASCASSPPLTHDDIDATTHIVAQMGAEPFLEAMKEGDVDIIVAGRAYDPAPFAALGMLHGIAPGVYWHMGKIMECGANCAKPKGKVIVGTMRKDSFDLEPMNPEEVCTPLSVAAHTLYEKSRPDLLPGPGGVLDLKHARYEQIDARTVRVSGSRFEPTPRYAVKLEGAGPVGYRTTFIGGIRDPILIAQIDTFKERIHAHLRSVYPELISGEAQFIFHTYGKDGVMGPFEPQRDAVPHEVGLLGEATAATQELANAICSSARIAALHAPYPGQVATAGNLALPLNPPENPLGPVCAFQIYHLMEVDTPTELFPIRYMEIQA